MVIIKLTAISKVDPNITYLMIRSCGYWLCEVRESTDKSLIDAGFYLICNLTKGRFRNVLLDQKYYRHYYVMKI